MDNRSREVILSLYSALVRLHLENQLWGHQQEGGHGPVEASPKEATEMFRGMKHLSCEESLRELGCLIVEKRRLWGDLIAAF